VKRVIGETVRVSLEGKTKLNRAGIVLYGPPGCGKTLLAKAVASECGITFLSVKGPELLNMYVGQSEHNVRQVFERARSAAPCIVFFDELDSLAPVRGQSGDSGGVMDRVVSQLLAELDGVQSNRDLFIIGATNRPDLLDQALLRPGRFDMSLYVGIGDDILSKTRVLTAACRNVRLAPGTNLQTVASRCGNGMSGADLYSIISRATMFAIQEQVALIEKGDLKEQDAQVLVDMAHLLLAADQARPSVAEDELQRYEALMKRR